MANIEDSLMRYKPESVKAQLGVEFIKAYFERNPLMSPRDVSIQDMSAVIIPHAKFTIWKVMAENL